MSITVKRTMIRPKGREEYESRTSTSQVMTIASQEIVVQAEDTTSSSNRAPQRQDSSESLPYYAGENITVVGRQISSPNSVQSLDVKKIVVIKKDDYDSLTAVSPSTLYLVYIPQPIGIECFWTQEYDIQGSGSTGDGSTTLNNSNISDYFSVAANLVWNDGTKTDISGDSGLEIIFNGGTAVTIPVNNSKLRRLYDTYPFTVNYSGFTDTKDMPIYQSAGIVVSSLQLSGQWVTNVPASGGTASSANCSFTLYYVYTDSSIEDATSQLRMAGGGDYIEVGENQSHDEVQLDRELVFYAVYAAPGHPIYSNACNIQGYQDANQNYIFNVTSAITFSNMQGESAITVTTDSPQWSVQPNESWITCSVNGNSVYVTVTGNTGAATRYGDVVFTYIKDTVTAEPGTAVTRVEQLYEGSGRMFSYAPVTYDPHGVYDNAFDANIISYWKGSVSTFVFDDDITTLNSIFKYNAAKNNVTAVYVPSTVVSTNNPFNNLSHLQNIYWDSEAPLGSIYSDYYIHLHIGDSVQGIPDSGFTEIRYLSAVTFGTSVRTIGKGAFYSSFRSAGGSSIWMSVSIPDTVEEMGEYVFGFNERLKTITIGSGLETIPSYAFYGYNGPNSINKQVYFGTNITRICTGAFGDGSSSQNIGSTVIHFNGTFAQWQNITIETNWHNFAALWVKCTDGNYYVAPDGSYWQ